MRCRCRYTASEGFAVDLIVWDMLTVFLLLPFVRICSINLSSRDSSFVEEQARRAVKVVVLFRVPSCLHSPKVRIRSSTCLLGATADQRRCCAAIPVKANLSRDVSCQHAIASVAGAGRWLARDVLPQSRRMRYTLIRTSSEVTKRHEVGRGLCLGIAAEGMNPVGSELYHKYAHIPVHC